jgi:hypothetical protein
MTPFHLYFPNSLEVPDAISSAQPKRAREGSVGYRQ